MMNRIYRRFRALLSLARNQAGKPEGVSAARLAERLRARYPWLRPEDPNALEHVRASVPCTSTWEREALVGLCAHWDLDLKHYLPGQRGHGGLAQISGPRGSVERLQSAWPEHRYRLEGMTEWMAAMYAHAAFPPAGSPGGPGETASAVDPSWAENVAAVAGHKVGMRQRPALDLPRLPPALDAERDRMLAQLRRFKIKSGLGVLLGALLLACGPDGVALPEPDTATDESETGACQPGTDGCPCAERPGKDPEGNPIVLYSCLYDTLTCVPETLTCEEL